MKTLIVAFILTALMGCNESSEEQKSELPAGCVLETLNGNPTYLRCSGVDKPAACTSSLGNQQNYTFIGESASVQVELWGCEVAQNCHWAFHAATGVNDPDRKEYFCYNY